MKEKNAMFLSRNLFQLFLLIFLFGCVSNKKVSQEEVTIQKKTLQQIAEKKFGEKVEYKLNSDKTYVLCQKIMPELLRNPNQLLEFFVYDIQHEEIIYEDTIANAKISWYNNTKLKITKQKGYTTHSTDTGKWTYIFDLKTKKRVTLKNTIINNIQQTTNDL